MRKLSIILLIFIISSSCVIIPPKGYAAPCKDGDEETVVIEDNEVQIVRDEFGNPYLKQYVNDSTYIYIPFVGQIYSERDDPIIKYN